MSLKEQLLEDVHNASHSLSMCVFRLIAVVHHDEKQEAITAYREGFAEWEQAGIEALRNSEKRFK